MNPRQKIIISLLVISILNGLLYAIIVPPWQAPDEPFYFKYTRIVVEEGRLPTPRETSAAGHPPLYPLISILPYFLGAPLGRKAQLLLIRLMGVIFSAAVALIGFKTVEVIFPDNDFIQLLVPLFIIFNPQYSFIGASINSDTLLVLLFSLLLYQMVLVVKFSLSWRRVIFLGINIVLGLLTKERFQIALIPLFLLLLIEVYRKYRPILFIFYQETIRPKFILTGVSLFFLVWRWLLIEPPKISWVKSLWLKIYPLVALRIYPPELARSAQPIKFLFFHQSYGRSFSQRMFEEFWGYFGWLQIPLNNGVYLILKIISLLGLIGLFLGIGKSLVQILRSNSLTTLRTNRAISTTIILFLFFLTIFLTFYAVSWYNITTGGGQGRYLFISIIPIFLFLSLGIERLFPKKLHQKLFAVLFVSLFALNMISLFWYIMPNYCYFSFH